MANKHSAEDEFTKIVDIYKHYSNLQFAELSVSIAITGAGLAFIFGDKAPVGSVRTLFMFGMALTAACFWIIWEGNSYQMWHFLSRALQLEQILGYKGFSTLPGIRRVWFRPGTWAFRVFYIGLLVFWIAAGAGRVPEPVFAHDVGSHNPTLERTGAESAQSDQPPVRASRSAPR